MAALNYHARTAAQPIRMRPTQSECISDIASAMHAAGVHPAEQIGSALLKCGDKPIRFRCEGDKAGRKNGWALFKHEPLPFAAFGNWRLGIREMWTANGGVSEMSPADREAIEREIAANELRRQQRYASAAQSARSMLAKAEPASTEHPYLARNAIGSDKLYQIADRLIVPIFDIDGRLWSVQTISAEGQDKCFLKGGKIRGNFWMCGRVGAEICIGEGVATMAAVRRATGFAVVAAMNAGNIMPVAIHIRQRRPNICIIICADDDKVGLESAEEAAKAVGEMVMRPSMIGGAKA